MEYNFNYFYCSKSLALVLLQLCLVYPQNNVQQTPDVGIYYAKLYAEPIANQSKSIILDEDEDIYLGLKCYFNKAVTWIYEDDVHNPIQVTFTILDRRFSDFKDESTYKFEAGLELIFKYKLINFTHLACVPYEDNSLITIVSGISVPDVGVNFTVMDEMGIKEKEEIVSELLSPISSERENGDLNCSINFSYLDRTGKYSSIYYIWTPKEELTDGVDSSPNVMTLENLRRNTKQIEEWCIKPPDYLRNKTVSILPSKESKYQGLAFYADSETKRRIAKGIFSVAKESELDRRFYFSWENFPHDEMYRVKGIPSEVYDQEQINISCIWSQFYFTNGIVISHDRPNQPSVHTALPLLIPDNKITTDFSSLVTQHSMTIEKGDWPIQNITVHFPLHNSSKWVSVPYTIEVKESQKVAFVNDSSEELTFNEGEIDKEVVCSATGIPSPDIKFISSRSDVQFLQNLTKSENESTLTITFPSVLTTLKGNYSCVAYNLINEVTKDIEIHVIPKGPDTKFSRVVLIIFGVASVVFVFALLILFLKIRARRKDFQEKTDAAIAEFLAGTAKNVANTIEADANHEYNSDFEVPHNHWRIRNEILGQGSFAVVVKGYVTLMEGEKLVAIKKIMSPSNVEDFKCALYELKLMAILEPHPNIVQLIAACTDSVHQRKIMLGLEYCINGDLLSYIKLRRGLHVSFVKDGQIDTSVTGQEKEELKKYENTPDSASFNTIDLYKWSFQTANGMSYLESKKIVHGDLSARNLLLSDEKTIKVSDFGLAKQMSTNEENMEFDIVHEAMPWKWMAPECLKDKKLSTKSDIWSYGVTLWEIFSLGEIPYPGYTMGPDYIEQLEKGMRMGKTKFLSDEVYDLMIKSWDTKPEVRPSFEEVKFFFMPKIGQMWSAVYGDEDADGPKINDPINNESAYCVLVS